MTVNSKTIAIAAIALTVFGLAVFAGFGMQAKEADDTPEIVTQTQEQESTASTSLNLASLNHIEETEDGLGIRGLGNPDAPVRMVEYASLTCSHCASFHLNTLNDLKKRYVVTGDLYIQFEEFPLNAPALDATLLARCLPGERYFGFIDLLFKTQESWAGRPDYRVALIQNAKLAGLSEDKANECLEDTELREAVAGRIQAVSQEHKISSTPTFIINEGEEVISGAQPLYAFEQIFRKVSDNKVATIKDKPE